MDNKMLAALIIIIIAVVGVGVYAYSSYGGSGETTIKVYAADSLAKQLNTTAAKFESEHPNVKVKIEYSGSQQAIRKVTDLNKSADIVVSADYGLIDKRLIAGNYSDWNLKYASNQMVIAYTNNSQNSSQINATNWYQIMEQSDVKFGFSDPNSDPAGYRAVMMLQLAESYYNDSTIFDNLVASNTAITSQANGTGYAINAPSNLNPNSKVMIRDDAAQLMPSLQSGDIDYVITYKNIAEQQKDSGIKYMVLPGELSLSNTTYESDYKKIGLVEYSGTNKSKTIKLSPIVYGITVLNNAPEKQLAIEFVQLLLSPTGTQIVKDSFQDPISPAIATNDSSNIPSELQQYVKS